MSFTPTTDGFDWNRVKDLTDMAETAITIGTVTPSDPHVGTEVYVNGKSFGDGTTLKKGDRTTDIWTKTKYIRLISAIFCSSRLEYPAVHASEN